MKSQAASFYLRTAPLVDKLFKRRQVNAMDIGAEREIQLGLQKFDKQRDAMKPFEASDQ